MDAYEEAVLFTIAELESRLDRVEYVLSGRKKDDAEEPRTFSERMQRIEKSLQELSAKTQLLNQVHQLSMCIFLANLDSADGNPVSKHSDLLEASDSKDDEGPDLTVAEKAAIVTSHAPDFATTASQLKALDDQQVPETDGFTKLVKLRPRIAEVELRQLQQALEISTLRRRSGLLVQRQNRILIEGQSRCWTDAQKHLAECEKVILRSEYKKKQREEEV
jgi:hypothetical protein